MLVNTKFKSKKLIEIVFNFIFILISAIYLFSGISKIYSPEMFINTVNILFINLFYLKASSDLLYFIVFIYISLEISLGILLLKNQSNIKLIIFLLTNNIMLTLISHYLQNINRLNLCGCFGKYSNFFYTKHFMILYTINILLILYIIKMLLYMRLDKQYRIDVSFNT